MFNSLINCKASSRVWLHHQKNDFFALFTYLIVPLQIKFGIFLVLVAILGINCVLKEGAD